MEERRDSLLKKIKARPQELKREIYTLYLAYRDPKTPWYAKVILICVVAYAISPIDLIPDFIPVLGYLDDLILVPLGISLAIKLIPDEVLSDCRAKAHLELRVQSNASWIAAGLIALIWIIFAVWIVRLFLR